MCNMNQDRLCNALHLIYYKDMCDDLSHCTNREFTQSIIYGLRIEFYPHLFIRFFLFKKKKKEKPQKHHKSKSIS